MRYLLMVLLLSVGALYQGVASEDLPVENFFVYKVGQVASNDVPTIDGKLDDTVWKSVKPLRGLRYFLGVKKGEIVSSPFELKVVTDGKKLYLSVWAHEGKIDGMQANPAKEPFWNDCVEFYFDPSHDELQRLQLTVDCLGRRWWEKTQDSNGYGWDVDRAWKTMAVWECVVGKDKDSWNMEVCIDCASFGIDPSFGKVCGFNISRFRFADGREFSAWTYGRNGLQKDITSWGHLIFTGKAASGISVEDAKTIFPDLNERIVQTPVEGGLKIFNRGKGVVRCFTEILKSRREDLSQKVETLAGREGELDDCFAKKVKYAQRLKKIKKQFCGILEGIDKGVLTIGEYDRLNRQMRQLDHEVEDLSWEIRLVELVMNSKTLE